MSYHTALAGVTGTISASAGWVDIRPSSLGNRFRAVRFDHFARVVSYVLESQGHARILDLGGTASFWDAFASRLPIGDVTITLVNKTPQPGRYRFLRGDARSLPELADNSFDIVHSNSLIEHVGRWADMEAMAGEVRRLAPRYFVQTPYFWFPMEPHAHTSFYHWLPEQWRCRLLMRRRLGYWKRCESVADAMRKVQSASLLDKRQFAALFPDAKIVMERAFGLPKSMLAIRD